MKKEVKRAGNEASEASKLKSAVFGSARGSCSGEGCEWRRRGKNGWHKAAAEPLVCSKRLNIDYFLLFFFCMKNVKWMKWNTFFFTHSLTSLSLWHSKQRSERERNAEPWKWRENTQKEAEKGGTRKIGKVLLTHVIIVLLCVTVSSLDVIRQFLFANECFAVYLAYFDESTSWYTDDGREFFLTLLTTSNGWWWWLGEFEQHIKTEREKKARVAGNNFSDGSAESGFCCCFVAWSGVRRALKKVSRQNRETRRIWHLAQGKSIIQNLEGGEFTYKRDIQIQSTISAVFRFFIRGSGA